MKRIPIVPTIVVLLALLLMIWLGVWQLERRREKAGLIAHYAANLGKPAVAMPALWPLKPDDLYRRVSATCVSVIGWKAEAGRTAAGATGWRHIAACRTGAEGPGFAADMGESQASAAPAWSGGTVRGRLVWAPDGEPLVMRLFRRPPPPIPMIVAEAPAPGLAASAQPDPAAMPNNHLAYAVQWFAFAAVALAIYAVALWRRARAVAPAPPES